jgi:hypothetical protein
MGNHQFLKDQKTNKAFVINVLFYIPLNWEQEL